MVSHKAQKMFIIVLTIFAFSLAASTLAVLTVNQNIDSTGTVTTSPNIHVYSNSACTNNMTTVSWGSITAGGSTTQTIYVKNTGTGTLTLGLSSINWNPAQASSYITVSWDKQGTQLSAGQSTQATITITVSSSITSITDFSNTISIIGTG
jgi:archaellum component FlaG (FlaF/FlaG flagellin family)